MLHSLFELPKNRRKNCFAPLLIFLKPSTVFGELRYGINCSEMKLTEFFLMFYNLYQNIKSCITLNGANSTFFESYIGLRQDENLSPVLFFLYFFNDLEPFLEENNVTGIEFELENDDLFIFIRFVVLQMTLPSSVNRLMNSSPH